MVVMLEFKNKEQFKAFMRKEAARLNMSAPNTYHTFYSRLLLERISKEDNPNLLVKGSSAEMAYLGTLVRGITDVDLAGICDFNVNQEFVKKILLNNDGQQFSFNLNKAPFRTPTGIIKYSTGITFDNMKQDLSIDFQDNYNRLIEPEKRVVPTIFEGDEPFEINVPSFEEYLAEKLCIIVESNKTDVLNTRLKDFYDIYQLHGGKYDYEKLTCYFGIMLCLRNKIDINNASTLHLNQGFIEAHKHLWPSVSKRYDFFDKEIDLKGAVYYTRGVLREQLQKLGNIMPDNNNLTYKKKRV